MVLTLGHRLSKLTYTAIVACIPLSAWAENEHLFGRWSDPVEWPIVAIHTALLPTGKVLAYDAVGDDAAENYANAVTSTRATVWDPKDNSFDTGKLALGYIIFCSGATLMSNGRVFIAGGNKNAPQALRGITNLTDFDPRSTAAEVAQRFRPAGTMRTERWYPSVTVMANGEIAITGGIDAVSTPEVRQLDGTIRQLTGATSGFASDRVYNWTKLAPNGKVAYLGPRRDLQYLNTDGDGFWEPITTRDGMNRNYGSHAMYDSVQGKVLVAGGGTTATDSALVVDLNTLTPRETQAMNHARRQHNLTILADGSVLATGGFAGSNFDFDYRNAQNEAEIWQPETETWTPVASMHVHRGYHSTALLLPDGSVLSAGGGVCSGCLAGGYLNKDAEIYYPPYLFKRDGSGEPAARPTIERSPDVIAPGQTFSIRIGNAFLLSRVALLKLGSVTHSTNMEQRYIPLNFRAKGRKRFAVTAPVDNNIAPPGYYMLIVTRKTGVPSEGKIIRVLGGGEITYAQ